MSDSKALAFIRKLRGAFKTPWLDCTDWDQVVISSLASENEYVKRPLLEPMDNLARAAACSAVVKAAEAPLSRQVAPLRVGKIATDSVQTFERLLHTAAAGHYALEATAPANTTHDKMRAAGAAWRHLDKAGVWEHQREHCPPQLKPEFKIALQLVVLLLTENALQEKMTAYRIKVLQAIGLLAPQNSELQRWALAQAKELIAVYWATQHANPNDENAEPNVMLAYVACNALRCDHDVVKQFLVTAGTVGGMAGLHDARVHLLQLGGARGLLEPPSNVVDQAMPATLLNVGSTDLTRVNLTQCAVVAGGDQPVQKGAGVVLYATKLPKYVPPTTDTTTPHDGPPAPNTTTQRRGWWPSTGVTMSDVLNFSKRTTSTAKVSAAPQGVATVDTDFM